MRSERIYKALLHCYPAAFRNEYGGQMLLMFSEQLVEARRTGRFSEAMLWLRATLDALLVAPREHSHVIVQDLNYAIRSTLANLSFAVVAIVSLSIGIGTNTAIFSLWHSLLHSPLPLVKKPSQLVILTNPETIGAWNGVLNGERPWVSFQEFEQLRDRADAFSGLMATQSILDTWKVRSEDGGWEDARGRFVSGEFFDVLGVRPALGRSFSTAGKEPDANEAVISYSYWQGRFGGRSDVLGRTIALRNLTMTVVGVAPAGFIGETVGQQPDVWAPLRLQPLIKPGQDGLHDRFPVKNMWLHVFGRIKPGFTRAQAEAQANSIFEAGLASFYGSASKDARIAGVSQSLRIHAAGQGVSTARREFSNSLTLLFAGVGVLLLITCANLANLLLARGSARRTEMALRMLLGASRSRLIRQLLTESLLLAGIGGLVSLVMASVAREALTRMLSQSGPNFQVGVALDPVVLAFTFAVTITAAILFGLVPAWQATRVGPGEILKEQGRGATGSVARVRWGRLLVSLQLALSLPLLVGAGLLARTLYNLQHVDLGYRTEGLVLAQLDTDAAGYDAVRRINFYPSLRERLRRIPGVEAVSYSAIGLFTGLNLALPIEVEAHVAGGNNDRVSPLDLVGPGYFSTVGVPILKGREILDGDDAGSPKVCVINEAFAKLFFAGRNAIGMHVAVVSRQARIAYAIVGIAKDSRTQILRGGPRPRFFVPWLQAPLEPRGAFLMIRANEGAGPVIAATRDVVRKEDASLPIEFIRTAEDQIAPYTAQDRSSAQLAIVFGCAALFLAAVGLYGVLSYGIARRRSEIAIRVALGAQGTGVIRMMLHDTVWLIVAGLAAGAGLSYAASRLIQNRLFGVAPQDPMTLALAVGLLVAVALSAAYLPARRAASLDPMATLRRE